MTLVKAIALAFSISRLPTRAVVAAGLTAVIWLPPVLLMLA